MNNLALWNAVEKTPPSQTKPITGKSYSGNSPKPHWLVHKATETFGPCGLGWGFTIEDERIEDGAGGERLHVARVKVWYKWNGERGEVEHIGGTQFSGTRKSGQPFTDEDAPKKSVTDALVKALSMIGFAGDIFLGRFDDSKYVAEARQEEVAASRLPPKRKQADISAHTAWKNKTLEEIQEDLPQLESRADLESYKRKYLTPETMSKLGLKQLVIQEEVSKLEDYFGPLPDEPEPEDDPADEDRMVYVRTCLEAIKLAKTRTELETWWKGESGKRRELALTPPQLDGLKKAVAERRDELPHPPRSDKPYNPAHDLNNFAVPT